MNAKEISEIRRRYRPDRSNISHVRGCFVNEKKEIISEFDQSLGMLNEEDCEQVLKALKKTLSGTPDRNLLNIEFSTKQVAESEEHKLLTALRDSEIKDDEAVHKLYDTIISSLEIEGNYLILLASDRYDVFNYSADGEKKSESESVFSYIICSICPTKEGRPSLSYYMPGSCFRSVCADTVLAPAELGFMFPAFDDRSANIYGALYYTKNLADSHEELAQALFDSELPMPAKEQKESFSSVLEEAVNDDCSMRVVRSVHNQLCNVIETHKAEKLEEPLVITKSDAGDMLRHCGLDEEKVTAFEEKFEETFGENAEINPKNIAEAKSIKVKTEAVEIKVSGEATDVLEARVINGVKYILIRADGEVSVNGVYIHI